MSDVIDYPTLTHKAPNARVGPPASSIASPDSTPALTRAVSRWTSCAKRAICMPQGLTSPDLARLNSIICATRMVRHGEALYRANNPFQKIYAIRTGSFKTVVMHRDGREQVTGFHLAGDVLGLDGICTSHHSCDAIAIEDSNVSIVPFHLLELLCRDVKTIQQHVHRMLSSEIVRESALTMLLGTMSADQRVAAFLLNMSARLKARGYSSVEFNLRMGREEIGSYLGMKLETVSRMLSKFHRDGLVDIQGKQIRILDLDKLNSV